MAPSDRQRKQYWAIQNQLTPIEKKLVEFYELQWVLRHTVPTIEEVATKLEQSQVSVNYYLQRKPVIKALESRGIPYLQHTQSELTATQVAVAVTMMNFADTRTNEVKLDQLGINSQQYYAWLNDPQFKNLIDHLADQNLTNIRPTAIGEFTKKINAGDWQAVKYFLDMTGEFQKQDQPQSEQLLRALIEIIQKHVKDPDIILAIANDIKLASANRTLEVVAAPPLIQGEFLENDTSQDNDPELERAKKMLGV